MKPYCIVKTHRTAGLFSQFNKVITCMELYERVCVDWRVTDGFIYGLPEDGNLWGCLFAPIDPAPLSSQVADVVELYPHYEYTGDNAGWLYLRGSPWRPRLNALWQRIVVNPSIMNEVDCFARNFAGRFVVSVLVRNNNLSVEQLSGRCPSLDEVAYRVETIIGDCDNAAVFLVCDNEEALVYFQNRFSKLLLFRANPRSKNMETEPHLSAQQSVEDAKNCLMDVLLLARSQHFVHPVSNMATAALYMSPNLAHTFQQGKPG